MWWLGRYSDSTEVLEIPTFINQSERCSTQAQGNDDTFLVVVTTANLGKQLLPLICSSEIVNKQFGHVEVRWTHNEQDMIQYVGKGIADFALVKENLMNAFSAQSTHGYRRIAYYNDYSTYLISLKEKPQINKQYLWGKRLGMLDYPSSRSGNLVPTQMLKELGMSRDDVQVVYANSHSDLRELLAAGDVDIISSYWQQEDEVNFSSNYRTPIQSDISGSKWYLKMDTENSGFDLRYAAYAFDASG